LPKILPPVPNIQASTKNTGNPQLKQDPQTVIGNSLQFDIKLPDAITPSAQGAKGNDDRQSKVLGQLVNNYRVQVSTSFDFTNVLLDETRPLKGKASLDFKKDQLSDGIYYYRYAFVDDLGFEGQHSAPARFTIDTIPPALEIDTPQDGEEFDTEFVSIEGKTEPDTTIKINDKTLFSDNNGKFISALMPKKGKNLISIYAIDKAGNTTKKELTIEKVKVVKNKAGEKLNTDKPNPEKEKGSSLLSLSLGTLTIVVIIGVIALFVK
jgi:hypothetical protein